MQEEDFKRKAEKKEAKKKTKEAGALMGFLLKNLKKQEEEKKQVMEAETIDQTDDKTNQINMYVDPRPHNPNRSDKMCDNFLKACEGNKYGWQWKCPNGNNECLYTHALPEGHMLQSTMKAL